MSIILRVCFFIDARAAMTALGEMTTEISLEGETAIEIIRIVTAAEDEEAEADLTRETTAADTTTVIKMNHHGTAAAAIGINHMTDLEIEVHVMMATFIGVLTMMMVTDTSAETMTVITVRIAGTAIGRCDCHCSSLSRVPISV